MQHLRILLITALLSAASFVQQDRGNVTGTVTDSTDAVIPGARINARVTRASVTLASSTSDAGILVMSSLKTGTHEISVVADGFLRIAP